MKLRYTIFIVLAVCGWISVTVHGRVRKQTRNDDYITAYDMPLMRTQQGFNYVLKNYPYVVAYAYSLNEADENEYARVDETYNLVQKYIQDDRSRYTDARVKFVGVNFEMGDLKEVVQRYNLVAGSEYLLFFKNRKLITTQLVEGTLSQQALYAFIDDTHLEDYVDEQLAQKARDEKRVREKSRYYRYYDDNYYGGMYGCCGGYGYRGYGCGGFGYGPYWGGGCGRGYGNWGGCGGCTSFGVSFSV